MLKIKNCPICGHEPKLEVRDMGYGNGYGYPGDDDYQYSCEHCKLVGKHGANTIYLGKEKVKDEAIKAWNDAVDIYEGFLKEKRKSEDRMHPFAKSLIISILEGKEIHLTDDLLKKLIEEVEKF